MTEGELNILSKIKVRPLEEQRDFLLEQNMLLTGKMATLEKENAELKRSADNWYKYEKETQYHKDIIKDLKKENVELKKFINAPLTKGRTTTRKEMIQSIWELSKQITNAKELILRLYNAGRDVLMCRAEEKAYDNLSNAINDKSIAQFLNEI